MSTPSDALAADSLDRRWIKFNAVGALLFAAAALVLFGLKNAIGAGDPKADGGTTATFLACATLLYGIAGAAWGVLTGAVLQRKLPRLPARSWIALHAALAAALLGPSEWLMLVPSDADVDPLGTQDLLMGAVVLGGMAGAATGCLQALVLRSAASGMVAWIAWSAIAFAISILVLVSIEGPSETGQTLGGQLVDQAIGFVAAMVGALLMLPALKRLQPL